MRYFSIKEKLILNYVIIGVSIIIVIGFFSYYTARKGIYDRTFDQLTSVKVFKKKQIEVFFNNRIRDIEFISSSKYVEDIIKWEATQSSIPQLEVSLATYLNNPANYDRLYIADKSWRVFEYNKDVISLHDGSEMSGPLVSIIDDILVSKETTLNDIQEYDHKKSMYLGSPVFDQEKGDLIGVIVLEISIQAINNILLNKNQTSGLGLSGEAYLVGSDHLMRSQSRFQDNSILSVEVQSEGVEHALLDKDSTGIFEDYRGIEVLSSYCSLKIDGLNWVILAEIDLFEAMHPLSRIRNSIFLISTLICLSLFLFAFIASQSITSPIIKLREASKRIGEGVFDVDLEVKSNDEIGDLSKSFSDMTKELEKMTEALKIERIKGLRSVIDGQDIERQRLSRELHDGLGQQLIALRLKLEGIQASESDEVNSQVKEIKDYVDQNIEDIKRISNNLMPAVLNEFGLQRAIKNLVETLEEQTTTKISFASRNLKTKLNGKQKTYIYRIVQEALNNAVKHSGSSQIEVSISESSEYFTVSVRDNGIGFIPEKQRNEVGNGLYNMTERASLLNGILRIESVVNKGTNVIANIPI